MREPLTTVRDLGPATAGSLRRAVIGEAEALRAIGADAAHARTLEAGDRPHLMAYQALVTGLKGRHLADAGPAERAAPRERFDAIRAAHAAAPGDAARAEAPRGIEATLGVIGVATRRPEPERSLRRPERRNRRERAARAEGGASRSADGGREPPPASAGGGAIRAPSASRARGPARVHDRRGRRVSGSPRQRWSRSADRRRGPGSVGLREADGAATAA